MNWYLGHSETPYSLAMRSGQMGVDPAPVGAAPCTVNLSPNVPLSARLSPMTLTPVMGATGVVSEPPPPHADSAAAATASKAHFVLRWKSIHFTPKKWK